MALFISVPKIFYGNMYAELFAVGLKALIELVIHLKQPVFIANVLYG